MHVNIMLKVCVISITDEACGVLNGNSKLIETDVVEILRRLASGESQRLIAAHFGISQVLVGQIHRGKIWRHLSNSI